MKVIDGGEVWVQTRVMVAGSIEALNEGCSEQVTIQFTKAEHDDVMLAIRSLGNEWKEYDGPKPEAWSWERFEVHEKGMRERGRLLLALYERLTA